MNQAEREQFATQGYVVLGDRAEHELLGVLSAAARDVVGGSPGRGCAPSHELGGSEVFEVLHRSRAWSELLELVAPAGLEHFDGVAQLTVNVPPNDTEPTQPHIDHHRRGAERPDSYSLLIAVLLTDQPRANEGNVWVWPGTHLLHGEYLAAYGPSALLATAGKIKQARPNLPLPRPVSVCGCAGDVVVVHPLLGHETGPNWGEHARLAVYFRLRRTDHESRWEECLTQPLLEYNLGR